MRFSRTGACLVMAGVYLALRVSMSMVRPGHMNPHLAFFLAIISIACVLLAQLGFIVSIAGLRMRPGKAASVALPSAIVVALVIFLQVKFKLHGPSLLGLSVLRDLSMTALAASLGCMVSRIIREPNILLPVAVCAGIVDLWNVLVGPLGHLIEKHPEIVQKASVHIPTATLAGIPSVSMGMGDIVFLALFFGVLYRFSMNVRGTFWLGYALLMAAFVMSFKWSIPALVPIGAAVIIANVRHFKLKREELVATLIVAALLLGLLIVSACLMLRR